MNKVEKELPSAEWRRRSHEIIFEAETRAGRAFDIALLCCIVISVSVVILESIASVRARYGSWLVVAEWVFTILFTIEYAFRLASVKRPLKYATSFFGVIDLLAIIPTYLSLLLPGSQYLLVIRILRLLRVFRVLKLAEYLSEGQVIMGALRASQRKISVFLLTVFALVVVIGSLMYVIEGEEHGFVNIPTSIYWAIVTLTTVGYGDLSPQTPLGKALASLVMIIGYGIIAVPTGIVTAELGRVGKLLPTTQSCPNCSEEGHEPDAVHCKYCGAQL
jgi:voltage-gated potassium channel